MISVVATDIIVQIIEQIIDNISKNVNENKTTFSISSPAHPPQSPHLPKITPLKLLTGTIYAWSRKVIFFLYFFLIFVPYYRHYCCNKIVKNYLFRLHDTAVSAGHEIGKTQKNDFLTNIFTMEIQGKGKKSNRSISGDILRPF